MHEIRKRTPSSFVRRMSNQYHRSRFLNTNNDDDDDCHRQRRMRMNQSSSLKENIMGTAKDAMDAKVSACQYGYYTDPFLPTTTVGNSIQPLIRKGTFARVACIDRVVSSFLSSGETNKKQIVILGSGMDTTYLRTQAGLLPTSSNTTTWYEVDMEPMIQSKYQFLSQMNTIDITMIHPSSSSSCNGYSIQFHNNNYKKQDGYYLIPFDLQTDCMDLLTKKMVDFQCHIPTLFVMECVQMYLSESSSQQLLTCISKVCKEPIVVLYDPILQHDAFGQVMKQHLQQRFTMSDMSVYHTTTLQKQIQKMQSCGLPFLLGTHMMNAYTSILTNQQRRHSNSCEMLDEMEEFTLLMQHYCILLAGKSSSENKMTQTLISTQPNNPIGFQPNLVISIPNNNNNDTDITNNK